MFHNSNLFVLCAFFGLSLAACGELPDTPVVPPLPAPAADICAGQPEPYFANLVECDPGEVVSAFCAGSGLTGYRTCLSDGSSWSVATCPRGGSALNQGADYLVVTRPSVRATPGFPPLVVAVGAGREPNAVATVDVDDLVLAFPAPSVPESIRAALGHFKGQELPRLEYVLLVGQVDSAKAGVNAPTLTQPWEVPLYYVAAPPGTAFLDLTTEASIPSLVPYSHVLGEFPNDFSRFWPPEAFVADVHVGYLPVVGALVCDSIGTCRTDLQVYADKRAAWKPDGTFRESQFNGASCAGEQWWDVSSRNGRNEGVTRQIVSHSCQDGEQGNMGPLATADGSDYLLYAWHGSPGGSSLAGGYTYDATTAFGGVVFAHSCLTGTPEPDAASGTSLGQAQLASPGGAIAYMGYSRVMAGMPVDPMADAIAAGRYTVGEALDGMREDVTRDLTTENEVKAMLSLFLYGDPALPLVAKPSRGVYTAASRTNADGSVDACVVAYGVGSEPSVINVGDREAATVEGGNTWGSYHVVRLTKEEIAAGTYVRLAACDPAVETCQVAEAEPNPSVRLECGEIVAEADGSVGLEVTSSLGMKGGGLAFEVATVAYECPEGRRSACYQDAWSTARREAVFARVFANEVVPDANHVSFYLAPPAGEDELFRAIVVRLRNPLGDVVGQCTVPMSDLDAEELGLL